MKIEFITTKIDHATNEAFSFIVPTDEAILTISINNLESKELFSQNLGPVTAAKINIQLERISESKWKIPATQRGQRIVRRTGNKPEILIFDGDNRDRVISGKEGQSIEIQYQSSTGRIDQILIELR